MEPYKLKGRYLKVIIDRPYSTGYRQGEYIELISDGGTCSKGYTFGGAISDLARYGLELMPEGFHPEGNLKYEPKVGDWIVITASTYNFNSDMEKLVGKCVQITSTDGATVKFKNDGGWCWSYKQGHFRPALEEEIPNKSKTNKTEEFNKPCVDMYIKAMVDFPNGGSVKAGHVGIITKINHGIPYSIDFPNHKGYIINPLTWNEGKSYKLLPKGYVVDSEKVYNNQWIKLTEPEEKKQAVDFLTKKGFKRVNYDLEYNYLHIYPSEKSYQFLSSLADSDYTEIKKSDLRIIEKEHSFIKGDYVVCLPEPKTNILPYDECKGGGGYRPNLCFQINDMSGGDNKKAVLWGGYSGNGVYYNSVRKATTEEAEEHRIKGKNYYTTDVFPKKDLVTYKYHILDIVPDTSINTAKLVFEPVLRKKQTRVKTKQKINFITK